MYPSSTPFGEIQKKKHPKCAMSKKSEDDDENEEKIDWSKYRQEYFSITKEMGFSAREHHSFFKKMKNSVVFFTQVKEQGIPAIHREWMWPLLLHQQVSFFILILKIPYDSCSCSCSCNKTE